MQESGQVVSEAFVGALERQLRPGDGVIVELAALQAFVVDGRSEGFYAKTIQDKIALRSVQNAHIKLENVFVPENNRLANVTNFEDCTQVLTHSRLIVAWKASGIAAGAYEAALKYTLEREQFFRPIAQF